VLGTESHLINHESERRKKMFRFRINSFKCVPKPDQVCHVVRKSAVIALCALIAFSVALPIPVLLSQPVHAKSRVSAPQQVVNFHGGHTHVFVPVGSALNADPPGSIAPVPIPGGDVVPPLGALHAFFPGPTSIGDDGFDIEPSTITNFKGFTGVAMLAGTATDANGNNFDLASDLRVFQGEYVSADGRHHRGTFVLI
jgi:hypothetical protein